MEEDMMGRTYSRHEGRGMHIGYLWEARSKNTNRKTYLIGRITVRCILRREIRCGDFDWIDLAQFRDQWNALMETVMKLRV
jgi:hypothetical protein